MGIFIGIYRRSGERGEGFGGGRSGEGGKPGKKEL